MWHIAYWGDLPSLERIELRYWRFKKIFFIKKLWDFELRLLNKINKFCDI